ncbi:Serine/threonine-protein kinase PknD [Streptomyces sp. RB5]|uniref:Serine/threonine-protein kinase PknD n=1 Tax=Streptomyces smaragdinus TaxID=2585196 RepID=A0A7K0CPX1_9ACTN|nr:Serine/threonine-protein kinase PknD [Streptomyces smaragdinus]
MGLRTGDPGAVGDYVLEARLGSGGMGTVYLARDRAGRPVAVKVVHRHLADDAEFRERFAREVSAARRVTGASTVRVLDAGVADDVPWMATEFVAAPALQAQVEAHGPLGEAELRRLAAGLAAALRDIHRAGVVHRDLKPGNVLLAADGPRVIDFGVSRAADHHTLTVTGRVIGSPPFMAPEQLARPRDVGPAADVFALGALLVYAATGAGPFDDDSPYLIAHRVVAAPADLGGTPEWLRPLVRRCLAKDPGERPTPAEVLAAVSGPGRRVRLRLRVGRAVRRGVAVGLAVGLLAVVGADGRSEDAVRGVVAGTPEGWRPWATRLLPNVHEGPTCAPPTQGALFCAQGSGPLTRFDPATGRAEWRKKYTGEEYPVPHLLAASSDLVLVQTEGDGTELAVHVVDAATGTTLWHQVKDSKYVAVAPVSGISRGVVALVNEGAVIGYEGRSGRRLWSRTLPYTEACGLRMLDDVVVTSCATSDENSMTTVVAAFRTRDGERLWSRTHPYLLKPLAADAEKIVVGVSTSDRRRLGILDPDTGRLGVLAEQPDPLMDPDPPGVLAADVYYESADDSTVSAVDLRTGRRLWRRTLEFDSPGAPAVGDRLVLVSSPTGRVAALDRATGEVRWTSGPAPGARLPLGVGGFTPGILGSALYVPCGGGILFSLDVNAPDPQPPTAA